jgi:hypothetical protein
MSLGLDHIQLAIPPGSEAECRAFWVGILDCAELEKPDALKARGGLWLQADGIEIHLGVQTPFIPAKKAHPAFIVINIDALSTKLTNVKWDTAIPNRKRLFTTDPVGNRLEFIQQTQRASF